MAHISVSQIVLRRKKPLWHELIRTMPDCGQSLKGYDMGWTSLHESLNLYMETVDQMIQKFLQDEPNGKYVYMYNCYYRDDKGYSEGYMPVYPALKKCIDYARYFGYVIRSPFIK